MKIRKYLSVLPVFGKRTGIAWFIALFSAVSISSAQEITREYFFDIEEREEDLMILYSNWTDCQSDPECDEAERGRLNMYFADGMSALIRHNPETFTYPFKQMTENDAITILESSDKKLRIYNWSAFRNTSMRDFYTVFQFKDETGINSAYGKADSILNHSYPGYITDLHSTTIAGKTYYFVIQNAILSSNDIIQSIECMTIENGELKRNVPVFKTKTKTFGSINFNFLRATMYEDDRNAFNLILYNQEQQQILIPVVNKEMELKRSYLVYQLKGNYFEYTGIKK